MAPETKDKAAPRTLLTAEEILAAGKRERAFQYVDVPGWGGTVKVVALTGRERDAYEMGFAQIKGNQRIINYDNARARLVALSVRNEANERIFTDAQVKALGDLDAKDLNAVYDAATELSGLGDEEIKKMVTVLGNGQSADGGSA